MKKKIVSILENSIAKELGIEPGDFLLSVNGLEIKDVFDYRIAIMESKLDLLVESRGKQQIFKLEKDEYDDIGLLFENDLMDEANSCRNKCIFCFIDQLPREMRKTLYFKDDDSRLSFLTGNYVTLTNVDEAEISRLIRHRLSPVNISVHAMNPDVRVKMLNNRFAAKLPDYLKMFRDANIEMNFQIVLCKGINDGAILEHSIMRLAEFMPQASSLSVVPVGLTKYRDENGLYPLEPFDKGDAVKVLDVIENWQRRFLETHETRFVYAADEFYLLAGRAFPDVAEYEGFPQIENGVGMSALLIDEVNKAVKNVRQKQKTPRTVIVTGMAAGGLMESISKKIESACKKNGYIPKITVLPVTNHFFGEKITVSGLLTSGDIIVALEELFSKAQEYPDQILLPMNVLRHGEEVFLDGMTVGELSERFGIKVKAVENDGFSLVEAILEHIAI